MADQVVDYSGEWLNTAQEGMDSLLKALGVGWAKRKVGSASNFGVGSAKTIVKQDGNRVDITMTGHTTTNNVLQVGGGPQELETGEGKAVGNAQWGDDGSLVLETKMMGSEVVVTRALRNPRTMEMRISHGTTTAVRIYELQ